MAETPNPFESPKSDNYLADEYAAAQSGVQYRGVVWLLFSGKGRIPRQTYWGASISIILVFYAAIFAAMLAFGPDSDLVLATLAVMYIPLFWTSIAVGVKRWHDRDKSGRWILIGLIPVIGPLWTLIEAGCLPGTVGPNKYGPDPIGNRS